MNKSPARTAGKETAMAERRFAFIVNIFFYAIIAALFYAAFKYLLPLILPFLIAFACAAALQRPIKLLSDRLPQISKKLIAVLVVIISLATVGTTAVIIIGALIDEIIEFINDIPLLISQFSEKLTAQDSSVNAFIASLPPSLSKHVSELYSRLTDDIPGLLISAADSISGVLLDSFGVIGSFAMRLPSVIVVILITIITTFFIAIDYAGARKAIAEITPDRLKKRILYVHRCSTDTMTCLLKTYAFLMLLTFTELAVGFAVFNFMGAEIPYVIPLALLTALVDILPVLGVGTVLIPWAVFDMTTGNMSRAVMLLLLYVVVVIIRNLLEPKLIGQRFGLHPALTLLSIYIGGKLFGFIGVFLLPLTLIVTKRLMDSGVFGGDNAEAG